MLRVPRRWIVLACAAVFTTSSHTSRAGNNWPSFRGPNAGGVSDGHALPEAWNVPTGEGVAWKTPIPGLAHSSPIIWGDRLFVTTADSGDPDAFLRVGLYGESPDHPEDIDHEFRVYCIDKQDGRIIWTKVARKSKPKVKRHIKSSHANCTPATDGTCIIVFFGSEGLYCYDLDGELIWQKDLGLLDAGAFNAPEVQWEFASSPIIHDGKVFVQCDANNTSFLAAYDTKTGAQRWRTERDDHPAWSTPAIWQTNTPRRTQVVVNGYKHIGGYNLETGESIWYMRGGGDIPVPTPLVSEDMLYITNAHGGRAPVYAIRASAEGDISLASGDNANSFIPWSYDRIGAYMQTPLVYRGHLYVCRDNGVLSCLNPQTGEKVYRKRLAGTRDGFSASGVAGDGKLYFTSEEGQVHVLKSGPTFDKLAVNNLGDTCMATPAISEGRLFFRARRHIVAIEP